jgi:hypothetical protein
LKGGEDTIRVEIGHRIEKSLFFTTINILIGSID